MAYVEMVSLVRNFGRPEMSGNSAIQLAEKAYNEGRIDEARGLVELAYRLFDEAADITCPPVALDTSELYPV